MRFLNKIVFINSAHIPYAEIMLNGNVHFIGTQGVGKSTLLRAILFFYNGDKQKLGIQREQKSFDEFYFPNQDSYIIYEVERENGKYFVMAFLSKGRCAFRFVDSPYDKHFFVSDDLNVEYEWGKISAKIGLKIFKSNIIRGYSDFRDIVYGNSHERELKRFSIMESQKYQNVPRTIQNIFLNQSLESRMIKDTIIDSMDFADDSLDLNFFREHLKDFKQKYEDIWKWYKVEKNGKVKVKVAADKVIDAYTTYETSRKNINELSEQLSYALGRDREQLPELTHTIQEQTSLLGIEKKRLDGETDKYNDELRKHYKEEGKLEEVVKKIKEKKSHYDRIRIEEIEHRSRKEDELKTEQESIRKQMDALTDKNRGIKEKFESLKQENRNQLLQAEIRARQTINDLVQELNAKVGKLNEELSLHKDEAYGLAQKKIDEHDILLKSADEEVNEWKLQREKMHTCNPYQAAMDEHAGNKNRIQTGLHEKQMLSLSLQKEIDCITNEIAMKRKDVEAACKAEVMKLNLEVEDVKKSIAELQELLDSQKGSLIEWLADNVTGWENHIGKVLDEKSVLYNTMLSPQKVAEGDNCVFGIQLSIDNVDREIRTPQDIEKEKLHLEDVEAKLRKNIAERLAMRDADIQELERRPAVKLKELRKDKANVDAELRVIPQRIEAEERELTVLHDKLDSYRKQELEEIDRQSILARERKDILLGQRAALIERRDSEQSKLKKEYESKIKGLKKEVEQKKNAINDELTPKKKECDSRNRELDARMDAELKGVGVDISALEKLRADLNAVANELLYIDQHRNDLVAWQNDKRELFDHEQETKDTLKEVRYKLEELKSKFEERKAKLCASIHAVDTRLREAKELLGTLKKGIESVEGFLQSSSCPLQIAEVKKRMTSQPLDEILETLKDELLNRQRKMEDFKQTVNLFKGNFSVQNTFNFHLDFKQEEDYIDFAVDLIEFVANQKMEEYRVRTSEEYANILQRIGREVSNLMNHKSDIEGTIGDINKDFKENNFAGVIKNIELRASESNDPLMRLMLNVNRFAGEHTHDIGELNLFSNEESRKQTNDQAVKLLMTLIDQMDAERKREWITLTDTFKLEFKVKENDQETEWTERLAHVGSDGTDILVKAMVNIMLINVFKRKVSRRFGDFRLHCMMDEIGKLHPDNVRGILDFGNKRNILLINSSPTTYNAEAYKYTYSLSKDEHSFTMVKPLLTIL